MNRTIEVLLSALANEITNEVVKNCEHVYDDRDEALRDERERILGKVVSDLHDQTLESIIMAG